VYRKKVTLIGVAPVERLSEPQLIQGGETARIQKPDIKLPWKRYIVLAQEVALLTQAPTEKEFNAMLNIWVDEGEQMAHQHAVCPSPLYILTGCCVANPCFSP